MNYYTCPVCGFNRMTDAPEDLNICPCCGTEFGNDTPHYSVLELRYRWVVGGMKWFSSYIRPPKNWNPVRQLVDAKLVEGLVAQAGDVTRTEKQTVNVTNQPSLTPIGVAA